MAERVSITPAPDAFAAAVIGAVIAHVEAEAAGLVPSPSPQLPAWVASARPEPPDTPIDRRPVRHSRPGEG
jgi:hypothetical protein